MEPHDRGAAGPRSPFLTGRFRERLEEARTRDPAGHARIREVMDRLLEHPEDADGRMHGALRGDLKKYVGRGGWRILYTFCAACRKAGRRVRESCPGCGTIPENSVVFLDLYRKNEPPPA